MLHILRRLSAPLRPALIQQRPSLTAVIPARPYSARTSSPVVQRLHGFLLSLNLTLIAGSYLYFTNEESVVSALVRRLNIGFPHSAESRLGQSQFDYLMAPHRGNNSVLPDDHPDTVRVQLILGKIVPRPFECPPGIRDKLRSVCTGRNIGNEWSPEWDATVVKTDIVDAFCLPGGKVIVSTGLLDCLESDDEIATVIGHGLGHVIARHTAEMMMEHPTANFVHQFFLKFSYWPSHANQLSRRRLSRPFTSTMEEEADLIGDSLLVSAGYDPSLTPVVKQKLIRSSALGVDIQNLALGFYIQRHNI